MDFRILGPLEVERDGRELPLGGRQQRALLVLLLLHANEVVPVDSIIDELWPEAPPPSATRSVHALVSRLRRLLEGGRAAQNEDESANGILATRAHGYVLRVAEEELDLHRFDAGLRDGRLALADGRPDVAARVLREALELWRGPPLGDFAVGSSADAAVAALSERRVSALEERIEADLASGRSSELVAELETLVAAHPLRERLRCQLMVALYRAGRQAEALQVYRDARTMLVGELGLEPSQTLQHLEQAILRQDESLEAPRRAAGRIPGRRRLLPAGGVLGLAALAAVALLLHGTDGSSVEVMANSIVGIDASTGRIVADARATGEPIGLASDDDGVWVANRGGLTVSRIDRNDASEVKTFRLDATTPTSIATSPGAVWLTVRGSLIRIDPEFGAVAATLDPDPLPSQYGSGAVAAGGAGVWFVGASGTARIDPSSNRVEFVVGEVAAIDGAITVGVDAVWAGVMAASVGEMGAGVGTLAEIKGRNVIATTPLNGRPIAIAVGARTVWIVLRGGDLVAVDADTAAVVANIDVKHATGVATAGRNVWVTSGDGALQKIDGVRRAVTKTIELGRPAVAVAAAGDRVWVAVG